MSRSYAFTTAAMSAALEETPVSYEDLAEIERDFDDAETEIIRQQVHLTAPLYTRRAQTVSQIPNFWPLVLEQAPPDIDQFIQPSDSALLLSSLVSLDVSHFQLSNTNTEDADPRSVSIKFEFFPNEYFTDTVLEKKFYHRRAKNGWAGLVSEPVRIHWKKGRDLTSGLLDLVCDAWEVEREDKNGATEKVKGGVGKKGLGDAQKALRRKIEHTGMGGLSFFAWFGFIGRRVSAEESVVATKLESARRERRQRSATRSTVEEDEGGDEGEDDDDDDPGMSLEIFPDGDDLAVAITEDLWPGAIKYFTQAQEQDALSDADFESDDEEGEEVDEPSGEEADRPVKKQRI